MKKFEQPGSADSQALQAYHVGVESYRARTAEYLAANKLACDGTEVAVHMLDDRSANDVFKNSFQTNVLVYSGMSGVLPQSIHLISQEIMTTTDDNYHGLIYSHFSLNFEDRAKKRQYSGLVDVDSGRPADPIVVGPTFTVDSGGLIFNPSQFHLMDRSIKIKQLNEDELLNAEGEIKHMSYALDFGASVLSLLTPDNRIYDGPIIK